MPEALLFFAAGIFSVDQMTNRLSAIFIDDVIQPQPVVHPAQVPENTPELLRAARYLVYPLNTVTIWKLDQDEVGQPFEQQILIEAPDGHVTSIAPPSVIVSESPIQRVMQSTGPFTGRDYGFIKLQLQVRRQNAEEWIDASEYRIFVQEGLAEPVAIRFDNPNVPQMNA